MITKKPWKLPKYIATILGFLVFFIGGLVIYGWLTKKPELVQIFPHLIPMQFNTALAFMLSGLGLFFIPYYRKISIVLGGIVFLLGFLTLLQYLLSSNFGIDELFIKHYITVKTYHIGRMAPNTSVSFTLAGLILMQTTFAARYKWSRNLFLIFSLIIIILAIVAFLGYIADIPSAYGWGHLTGMALHTSISFLLLGVGFLLVFLYYYRLESQSTSWELPATFFLMSALLFFLFWYALQAKEKKQLNLALKNEARFIGEKISSVLDTELKAIDRLFKRTNQQSYGSEKSLMADATSYLNDMPSLNLVSFSNSAYSSSTIQYRKNSLSATTVQDMLQECEDKKFINQKNIDTKPNYYIFVSRHYLCVYGNNYNNIAIFSLEKLIIPLAKTAYDSGYAMQLKVDDDVVYQFPSDYSFETNNSYTGKILTNTDTQVSLSLWPMRKAIKLNTSEIPLLLIIFGLAFTVMITVIVRILQITRIKSKKLLSQETEIETLTYYDPLTGIPNRAQFERLAKKEIAQAKILNNLMAIMIINLDHFKKINDSLGHKVGDQLLKAVVARIEKISHKEDILTRYGGDEFILITSLFKNIEQPKTIAKKIIEAFSHPFLINKKEISITASIGIATYPFAGDEIDTLVRHADIAIQKAKKSGKNTYFTYTQKLEEEILLSTRIENQIREAVSKNQFKLYYQPIFRAEDQKLYGFDTLLRWDEGTFDKSISPEQVITTAEESGQILVIGQWILAEAFKQFEQWNEKYNTNIKLTINVSPKQLLDKNWLADLKKLLEDTKVRRENIIFEITETAIVEQMKKMVATLNKTTELGFLFLVDDFCTGYSSLQYIQQLPVCGVKIDKSFIQSIDERKKQVEKATLAESIFAMVENLHLIAVAEGVETASQLAFVKRYPNSLVQGYYLSKPLSAEDATKRLETA